MKSRATQIKYIVIHCQAGHGNMSSMMEYWRSIGWKSPGYNIWIDYDGTVYNLSDYEKVTNGVKGFNPGCINICYRGGVDKNNHNKAIDTRTDEQKYALKQEITNVLKWLKSNGKDISKDLMILGHRDFSPDKNNNGVIESNERIKECPCFDAISEYGYLLGRIENQVLPSNRKK